jgi:hypothetical protein
LYISRARNDIFPLLYSSLHPLATTAAPAGGCLARFWCLGRQGDADMQCWTREAERCFPLGWALGLQYWALGRLNQCWMGHGCNSEWA